MNDSVVQAVINVIQEVTGGPCALHEPVFQGNEQAYVAECIETGWVSSVGAFVDRLERDLVQCTGAQHAIATVNGTSALHVALILAGVEKDDEVIVPALSFVATANAVTYCGAAPHFVDVCDRTLGMCPEKLERHFKMMLTRSDNEVRNRRTGRRVAAIVPMHTFGHPCEIDSLCKLADDYGLPIVEDAAESLGSFYSGRHTGTFGLLGTLSFNGNKIITSGGGGAILTNDSNLARRAKHLTTTAKIPHKWDYVHDMVGFNYRMPNLNAALGCAQLEKLSEFLGTKRSLATAYEKSFARVDGVSFITEPSNASSNYWLNAIRLDEKHTVARNAILEHSIETGMMTRPTWTPLNRLPMYQDCTVSNLETTEALYDSIVNIPSGAGLSSPKGTVATR
jgi:perosamine synthetase